MRRLHALAGNPIDAFDACVENVENPALSQRFHDARAQIQQSNDEYAARAAAQRLFSFVACNHGHGDQVILGGISKAEFVELYSTSMVGDSTPGRRFYDRILMLAPRETCPFCGFGQATTLDHFLSKARYPAFSVLSTNLIPCCKDCNKGKGSAVLIENDQIPHPYFEHEEVETDVWLYAEILPTLPACAQYSVRPPDEWPDDLKRRITNLFDQLDLAKRFSVQAATELAGISKTIAELKTADDRAAHLRLTARGERRFFANSWKAALYQALAASDWFSDEGFEARYA